MNIADVLAAMRRRWQLSVAGVLASGLMCLAALILIGPTYEDKSTVLLLPPTSSVPTGQNPYLDLSGLSQMVDVLSRTLYSQPVRLAVQERWPSAEFTVEPDANTTGPLIAISVRNSTPEQARQLTTYLVQLLPEQLRHLQADLGVRPRAMITADVLTQYSRPEVIRSKQLRAGIVAGGAGLVLAVLFIGLADRALLARAQGRNALPSNGSRAASGPHEPDRVSGVEDEQNWQWGDVEAEAVALAGRRNGAVYSSHAK